MANLETLELTISSNSAEAKKGIDNLITSLSALPDVVKKAAKSLGDLNKELAKMKKMQGFNIPSIGGFFNGGRKATASYKQSIKGKPITAPTPDPKMLAQGWKPIDEKDVPKSVRKIQKQMEQASAASKTFGDRVSSAFKRVSRIATTMVTRLALKALIKNFTEAWNSAYEFSRRMGGTFAKNIDQAKSSLRGAATSIVQVLAPAMQIITPIINVVATGIKYLCDAITQLLKLIGISSEMFGVATEEIGKYGSGTKQAAQNVVAGFDELNVLNDGDSGGSGSGSGGSSITGKIADEIDAIKLIVGEALLAVGLILAFSGHIPVGIGLAAIGAAAIVGTIVNKWGTLTDDVKQELLTIMTIAGGAMLAVGLILAFTGRVGLGVALAAVGAANMATSIALSWGLSGDIKKEIGKITAIVGGALLAVGAILALTGVATPLGIAMMAAGGVSLVASAALNWDYLKNKIISIFNTIGEKLSSIWEGVSKGVSDAWSAVTTWIGARWEDFKAGWDYIKSGLVNAWNNIKKAITDAWHNVQNWISLRWKTLENTWNAIKEGFVKVWEGIKQAVVGAWNKVVDWANTTWSKFSSGWENIKSNMSNIWNGIKESVVGAWNKVVDWIGTTWNKFTNWDSIKQSLVGIWNGVQTAVTNAWGAISKWWDETAGSGVAKIKSAWGNLKSWFETNVTKPIAQFFVDLVNGIINAFNKFIDKINGFASNPLVTAALSVVGVNISSLSVPKMTAISLAEGAYDIPKGQLFIANEAGAEMVGSMDGKTAVANQEQIIEGIRRGVADGQAEQNQLLRRQNELLTGILQKDSTVRLAASSMLGRITRQSLDMYSMATGG